MFVVLLQAHFEAISLFSRAIFFFLENFFKADVVMLFVQKKKKMKNKTIFDSIYIQKLINLNKFGTYLRLSVLQIVHKLIIYFKI